jgi:hypothetical protein
MQFRAGAVQSSAGLSQAQQTSDIPTVDLVFGSQRGFATATGTNRTAGSIVAAIPAVTNAGTAAGAFRVTESGAGVIAIAPGGFGQAPTSGAAAAAIWLNLTRGTESGTNYSIAANSINTTVNGVSTVRLDVAGFDQLSMTSVGAQFFRTNGTVAFGGGTGGIISIDSSAIVPPTALPTTAVLVYANTGSPGSLGLMATGIQFNKTLGTVTATIGSDGPTTDVIPNGILVQAASAFAAAVTNTTGGSVIIAAGAASALSNGTQISLSGGVTGGGVPTNLGTVQFRTSGVGGNLSDPSTLSVPFAWITAPSFSIASGGTITLSGAQAASPVLTMTGTTAGTTIAFPNVPGFWLVDFSTVTGPLTFTSGSGTTAALTAVAGAIVTVVTMGGNRIRIK